MCACVMKHKNKQQKVKSEEMWEKKHFNVKSVI